MNYISKAASGGIGGIGSTISTNTIYYYWYIWIVRQKVLVLAQARKYFS
jgi:hypothetical protein